MKYIGIGLANIAFCGLLGFAVYVTKDARCLLALFLLVFINGALVEG